MNHPANIHQVMNAFRAISFAGPYQFRWLGRKLPSANSRANSDTSEDLHFDLVARLTEVLYGAFYCSGGVLLADSDWSEMPDWASDSFLKRLIDANTGKGFDDKGWQVQSVESDCLTASHDGLTVHNHWPESKEKPCVGEHIAFYREKGSATLSPGYYFAFGDEGMPNSESVVRLYWNTTAEGAVGLMSHLTRLLNEEHIPFGFKVLARVTSFRRADSAVLFLSHAVYQKISASLIYIYQKMLPCLKDITPAFTKVLAPGVGIAESPADGSSFGEHRCSLLAEAITRAYEQKARSQHKQYEIYEMVFREKNLNPVRPYLNPDSQNSYDSWHLANQKTVARSGLCSNHEDSLDAMEIALKLGHRLCEKALWWRERCTWLGIEHDPIPSPRAASTFQWRTIEPGLYSGTAGVGLFLGYLAQASNDPVIRKTAEGALWQSVAQLDQVPVESRFGYYEGWAGISAVVLEVARAVCSDELRDAGLKVAKKLATQDALIECPTVNLDLMSGKAGAITAIVTCPELLVEAELIALAVRLGQNLIQNAVRCTPGLAWRTPRSKNQMPLTGISHGASGIALALLELNRAVGCMEAKQAAEQAFAYERSFFDVSNGNWPDLRGQIRRRKRWHEAQFLMAWCHGAPGIALARARGSKLCSDPLLRQDFNIAREATRRSVASDLATGVNHCAMCHGILGNAEVLASCAQVLNEPAEPLVSGVAAQISRAAGKDLQSWPCDFPRGEMPPSLMLGLAGIGMFFLRRAHPLTPSPLLPWSTNPNASFYESHKPLMVAQPAGTI